MFYLKQCKLLIIFCLLAFSLSGCGGGSSKQVIDAPIPERKPPVVNAGEDQVITEESTVTLSAVATDSDGEIVTYLWTQISGDDVQLNRNDLAEVTFLAPDLESAQTLIFKVEVTDNDGLIHSDEVAIEVQPFSQPKPIAPPQTKYAPIVNAGEDQVITEESTVTLSAVATDSDGEIVTYLWTQISGDNVQLNRNDRAEVTFSAPDLESAQTLIFRVEVTDNDRLKHSDEVAIEVRPFSQAKPIAPPQTKYAPVVNAGEDQTVKETATVTLVAVATDSDGSIEAYQWAQTSGPSVQINNDDKAEATFSAPDIGNSETLEFEIVVTDNDGLTASDKVVINLVELVAPTVNAGDDQTVKETATVTLVAVATDSDGSIEAYQWAQTSGPSVQINNDDKAEATFSAPEISQPETLEFEVLVTDSDGLTASDKVVVNLVELVAPTVNAGEDQTVKETATVTLVAVATDSDGSIEAYQWAQTSGPSVQINNDDKAEATFSAPEISQPETLEFEVLVTDSDGLTTSDKVVVIVNFIPTFTNVNVIAGDKQITLSWELNNNNQIDQIRYFNVENNLIKNEKIINDISQNEYSISGLNNGLPYYFQLDTSVSGSVVRHVTEGIPKSSSTGLLNDTGLFYDSAYLKALEEQVPNNLMPKYCSDKDGVGQQDCSHGRNAQLLAGNLSRSGINTNNNGFDFNILGPTGNLYAQKPWTCVRDNHTGLVWEVKTDDGGIHDKDNKYRWGGKTAKGNGLGTYYPDWDVLVNGSNADYFCGYNDWRVPTLKELHSVIDYSKNFPTFDKKAFFTNTIDFGIYWTSSPFAESDEDAWYIFLGEPLGNKAKRENNYYVRLVRGGGH
jgi:predicted lipoprotein with Yx(FWY)xxD motif